MYSFEIETVMQGELPPTEEEIKRELSDLRAVIVERRQRSRDLWDKAGLPALPPDVPEDRRRVMGRFTQGVVDKNA